MLNHEEIKNILQRITKIKPFLNKYKREGINFPSEKNDWKKYEKNNVTIVLNLLTTNVPIIQNSVSWFGEQINCLVSIWWEHWSWKG